MIPDLPNLSSPTIWADFIEPNRRPKAALVDYARGGVALLDASKGLNVKTWKCEARADGIFISASGVPYTKVEELPESIDWLSFAFDQNMHYNFVYTVKNAGAFLYYYDTVAERYGILELGRVSTPIIRMDDVRDAAFAECELVVSYIDGGNLCVRTQRDRFTVPYILVENAGAKLTQCGMNVLQRFQWAVK